MGCEFFATHGVRNCSSTFNCFLTQSEARISRNGFEDEETQIVMRQLILVLLAGVTASPCLALDSAAPYHVVPVMANNPGMFGAVFKTRVTLLNPTGFSYTIYVNLYSQNGKVGTRTIAISPHEAKNYENFLEDVFGYSGAGTVELDSWFDPPGGTSDYHFLVKAEVYTDSPSGEYKTVVATGAPFESIGSRFEAYTPGIFVGAASRANIGCFNDSSSSPNTIQAHLYSASGSLIRTYSLSLPPNGWSQTGIADAVSGGYILWQPQTVCYCYAVVVDNRSNDGAFIRATEYIP